MTENQFLKHVRSEVKADGGSVWFSNKHNVCLAGESTPCSGYWDESKRRLVASKGQDPESFFTLVMHEFCHFIQCRDGRSAWTDCYKSPVYKKYNTSFEEILFGWIDGKNWSPKIVKIACRHVQFCELDCERLCLNLIDELDLPVEKNRYARRASAYIHFHNVIPKVRQFYVLGKEVYNIPQIIKLMPTNLDGEYKRTSLKVQELMIKLSTKKQEIQKSKSPYLDEGWKF
jgi:hypothetical protein